MGVEDTACFLLDKKTSILGRNAPHLPVTLLMTRMYIRNKIQLVQVIQELDLFYLSSVLHCYTGP